MQLAPPDDDPERESKCKTCIEANMQQQDAPRMATRLITSPLQVVGSDLQTIEVRSYDGKKYFALYCDAATRTLATVALAKKSDQAAAARLVLPRLMNLANSKIDTVRADQGGEYTSAEFQSFCSDKGIRLELSDTDQPFQNGLAETMGKKLVRMMRAARTRSWVPKAFWTENLILQTWVANRVSTRKQNGKSTPLTEITGQANNLAMAKPFGCEAWYLTRRTKKEKLSPRARRGVFMAVCPTKKAWRILDWETKKIVETRNATFFIDTFPFRGEEGEKERAKNVLETEEVSEDSGDDEKYEEEEEPTAQLRRSSRTRRQPVRFPADDPPAIEEPADDPPEIEELAEDPPEIEEPAMGPRRSNRIRRKSVRFPDDDSPANKNTLSENQSAMDALLTLLDREDELAAAEDEEPAVLHAFATALVDAQDHVFSSQTDPKSEAEAWTDPEWRASEKEEWRTIQEAETFELAPRPTDEQVLPSRMVYKTKLTNKGEKKKTRFVVKGCCDRNKDEKKRYAPTLRYASLRVIFALAALFGVIVHQLDVKGAFLHGNLPKPIYVEQPINLAIGDPAKTVLKLKKSLYGLSESPRLWNETLDKELTSIGFRRLTSDSCVYALETHEGKERRHLTVLACYVDDITLFGTCPATVNRVKNHLRKQFKINELGHAEWILGMKVNQLSDVITLDQSRYLSDMLQRFGKYVDNNKRDPTTPFPAAVKLQRPAEGHKPDQTLPYRELIGSLLYLAIGTRPDIAYSIGVLSRYVAFYDTEHWEAALHVLRYLRGTANHGLTYKKRSGTAKELSVEDANSPIKELYGFVDADFATDFTTSKSISGHVFIMSGSAVSWRSKQQPIVATSTCHAEYVAACEAAREAVWLRELLREIGFKTLAPTPVYEDNEAALFLSENPATTDRSKHIRLRWHYLRQCVRDGTLKLKRVETKKNAADALTKAVGGPALQMMRDSIGLGPIANDDLEAGRLLRMTI